MYGSIATASRSLTMVSGRRYSSGMRYHSAQFRAARAALDLGAREVAAAAKMSFRTLSEIEQPDAVKNGPSDAAVARLVEFYESLGVTFLSGSSQGIGIRFRAD